MLIAALLGWSSWHTVPVPEYIVRVTDGSEPLAEDLARVLGLIHQENERVTSSDRPWVSIAVMFPLRSTDDARNNQKRARRHLQGAYLAQYWSNHPTGKDEFGTEAPLIRLLIADTGQDGQAWRDTVTELKDMVKPESGERLVAAAGLGLSTNATQEAVNELAAAGILMVGSVITATDLAAPGLVRVAPTNSDEAAAMIKYLSSTEDWKSATAATPYNTYLIQDRADDDTFVEDLGKQYRQEFPNDDTHILPEAQGDFDSQREGAGNALVAQIATICAIHPKVVFFAGRGAGLRTFLRELTNRPCLQHRITVVTGDSGANLEYRDGPLWGNKEGANFDVFYTALASPQAWLEENRKKYGEGDEEGEEEGESIPSATTERFDECPNCFVTLFSAPELDDGNAIMSHDAALTAIATARNALPQQQQQPTAQQQQPTANALINGLYQINWTKPVAGASGWIYFQRAEGTPDGVPYNKAIPIMKLNPDSPAELVTLSSRSGTPPGRPQPPR
ncbi:MAG: ABC transporter substrate-binding protein [Pseudonocardiaceae bacterium]